MRQVGDDNPCPTRLRVGQGKLGDKDSNLDKQNQNLLCYRYTIAQ